MDIEHVFMDGVTDCWYRMLLISGRILGALEGQLTVRWYCDGLLARGVDHRRVAFLQGLLLLHWIKPCTLLPCLRRRLLTGYA